MTTQPQYSMMAFLQQCKGRQVIAYDVHGNRHHGALLAYGLTPPAHFILQSGAEQRLLFLDKVTNIVKDPDTSRFQPRTMTAQPR